MTIAYMPFTYIPESTARLLAALVGPVVIYQPLRKNISENLSALESQGFVEIRTPMTQDDDRLRAALVEFTDWARMNPGKSTPGAGFFSARHGEVPFYEETAINRIRSEIKRYHRSDHLADRQTDETEAGFSARLFLSLAQDNDLATDRLDHDLNQFEALEKNFLVTLKDADDVGFNRQAIGGTIWRDDPGAKLTGQRIRAWATLAAAELPQLLITTSRAVIDTLMETHGETIGLEKLADCRLSIPSTGTAPVLGRVLVDLANRETLTSADLSPLEALAADAASGPAVSATFFVAKNRTTATVIRRMAPATAAPPVENGTVESVRHTLILLVEHCA